MPSLKLRRKKNKIVVIEEPSITRTCVYARERGFEREREFAQERERKEKREIMGERVQERKRDGTWKREKERRKKREREWAEKRRREGEEGRCERGRLTSADREVINFTRSCVKTKSKLTNLVKISRIERYNGK